LPPNKRTGILDIVHSAKRIRFGLVVWALGVILKGGKAFIARAIQGTITPLIARLIASMKMANESSESLDEVSGVPNIMVEMPMD
jgi:hypothetical protein